MNIHDLPPEILEKILVEGNFYEIQNVNKTWKELALKNKYKFSCIFFDLTKDDPEIIKNRNPDILFMCNSKNYDKNGLCIFKNAEHKEIMKQYLITSFYKKTEDVFNKISSLNTLNFIFDSLFFIKDRFKKNFDYFLDKKLFVNNDNNEIYGTIVPFSFEIIFYFVRLKFKNVNIKFEDIYCQIQKKRYPDIFFDMEIYTLQKLISLRSFKFFKNFTFDGPNNTYLIYNEDKKLLIIRFGNYEKYNLPWENISFCKEYCNFGLCTSNHKQYLINSFGDRFIPTTYYPALLIKIDFRKLLCKKIENLIIISYEYYEFMFDKFYEISKKTKCKIKYHCLDQSKTEKIFQGNFIFEPIIQEKVNDYSFDKIHFKTFKRNIF